MGTGLSENEMEWVQDKVGMRWRRYRIEWVWVGVGTGLREYGLKWVQDRMGAG